MNTGVLTLLLTSIPPLVGVAAKIYLGSSDGRLVRKIEKDIELREKAPEKSHDILDDLIHAEVLMHARRRINAANRTINWPIAFWIVVFVLVTAGGGWGLAYLAITYWWPIWILVVLFGLFGALWIVIGIGQLFDFPSSDDEEDVNEAAK